MSAPGGEPSGTAQRFHLGCGDVHLDGFVNVDVRATPAADRVADLSAIEPADFRPAGAFFAHAFLEHLPRGLHESHLIAIRTALVADGFACYLGLPDFRVIAQSYLDRGPGVVGPVFDLYNAYRYTHGDPEAVPSWYAEQLHKALFDHEEVDRLLAIAGFRSWLVFRYTYPGEVVPVNLGFFATVQSTGVPALEAAARQFLAQFDGRFLSLQSLEPAAAGAQSRTSAAVRSSQPVGFLRRVSWAASVVLSRWGRRGASGWPA